MELTLVEQGIHCPPRLDNPYLEALPVLPAVVERQYEVNKDVTLPVYTAFCGSLPNSP